MCQNSPYRLWGLVVETKTIKLSIGTRVRKRTFFPLHSKSPHTLFSAPLTGIILTRVVHTSFPDHLMSHSTTRLFTCYSVDCDPPRDVCICCCAYLNSTEFRRTITSCPHIPQTWITATQYIHLEFCTVVKGYYCTVVWPKIRSTANTNVSGRITNSTE